VESEIKIQRSLRNKKMAPQTTATTGTTTQKTSRIAAAWPETIVLGSALAFYLFWSAGRIVSYFVWTMEHSYEDFKHTVIRADADPSVAQGFYDIILEPMYKNRIVSVKTHIALSVVCSVMMLSQLTPRLRVKKYARHRFVGWCSVMLTAVWAVQMAKMIFYDDLSHLPRSILVFDYVGFAEAMIGLLGGVTAVYCKDIKWHRALMMLLTAGMLLNPCQRFFWAVFSQLNLFGGPYKSFDAWWEGPAIASMWAAIFVNTSVALYYGLVIKPLDEDMRYDASKRTKAA